MAHDAVEDALDDLYRAPPKEFTAQRTRLAAAAKKRGDAAAAKRIGSAHKPTTAAWIVNMLALTRTDTAQRLADLGDRLREAHAAMDGASIRDLSAEQHRLIGELTREALAAAGVAQPSSGVRDDLTNTLQAAVADPEVRGRLGRLERPEQWSGFGEPVPLAADAPALAGRRAPKAAAAAARSDGDSRRDQARGRRRDELSDAVAAAERDRHDAAEALAREKGERDAARRRHDEALRAVREAQRALGRADDAYDEAERASRAAAESLREAKARLKRA